eukprot:811982_1
MEQGCPRMFGGMSSRNCSKRRNTLKKIEHVVEENLSTEMKKLHLPQKGGQESQEYTSYSPQPTPYKQTINVDRSLRVKESMLDGGNHECQICLQEYNLGEKCISIPEICVHRFHKDCLLNWLEVNLNTKCPCCRRDFVDNKEIGRVAYEINAGQLGKNSSENIEDNLLVLYTSLFMSFYFYFESALVGLLDYIYGEDHLFSCLTRHDIYEEGEGETLHTTVGSNVHHEDASLIFARAA